MILPIDGQQDVAKRQLRLGEIAPDEVGVFRCKRLLLQLLAGKEQTGTAVHQEARGFREWNALSVTVIGAAGQQTFLSPEAAVPHEQVIIEHAHWAAAQFLEREKFE